MRFICANRIESAAIIDHHNITLLGDFAGELLMTREPGLAVIAGDTASWGEFHGYACKQNGVAGAIIDGATRDAPEIRTSGFPTLVRGLTPVSSKWDLKTASINEQVMLGQVEVSPGDIIFADETGIVIIPVVKKDGVLSKANEIRAAEDSQRSKIV